MEKNVDAQLDLNRFEYVESPAYLHKSTFFFGDMGSGKTTFMTTVVPLLALSEDNLNEFINYIETYSPLFDHYNGTLNFITNYDVKLNIYGLSHLKINNFDPFKFMRPNDDYIFDYFPKYLNFLIDEAHEIYPAKKWQDIPEYVYHCFTLSRKMGWKIYLASQRFGFVAKTIRTLYQLFVYPIKFEILSYDSYGDPSICALFYLEFYNENDASEFYDKNTKSLDELYNSHSNIKYTFVDFNPFGNFDTLEFSDVFLPKEYRNSEVYSNNNLSFFTKQNKDRR